MGYHHQNAIVERRIKELTLGSQNFLLHATILWPETVSTMLWPFYFKVANNSLEMDEDRKTPEKIRFGVELQICPTDYHTWGCPVFVLEAPL